MPVNLNETGSVPTSRRVVTFYSYKGGVGRSMAMANIALLLARDHGLKVLAIDWDLEAPGLHRYFNMSDEDLGEGIIDYLENYKTLVRTPREEIKPEDLSIKRYAQPIYEFNGGGSLHLIGAGSQKKKSSYISKVRGFDWDDFYREWNGAQVIEGLRNEFLEMADLTLIDSRTGITDVGGVCTVQLPDIVVFVFVFNIQNLAGIEQVASELSDNNNPSLKVLRRKPELLFLPCRKELSELVRLREWEAQAAKRFEKFCDTAKIRNTYSDTATYLRKASIPYVPYFAYGEELAAKSDKGVEMAEAFEPLINLMLGELPSQSVEEAQRNWMMVYRRVRVFAGVLAALSATMLVWIAYRNSVGSPEWGIILRGAFAGILGASLSSLMGFQGIAKEDPWKLTSRYTLVRFLKGVIGGCVLGVTTSLLWPFQRFHVLASMVIGFMWRPAIDVFAASFLEGFNSSFTKSFYQAYDKSRASRKQ